jgi:urease accessory protein
MAIDACAIAISAPDPIVCYAGSRYSQCQKFNLSPGAGLVMIDWLTSGRHARGERWAFDRYESRTEVHIARRCTFRDAVVLDPTDGELGSTMRMGLCDCFATVLVVGKLLNHRAATLLEFVKAQPISRDAGLMFSASAIDEGVVLRIAGRDTQSVACWIRERLDFVFHLVGQRLWSRRW